MTPSQLRFEIFKHASFIKGQEFAAKMEDYSTKYSNLRSGDDIPICPTYPSFDEILTLAKSISDFVE